MTPKPGLGVQKDLSAAFDPYYEDESCRIVHGDALEALERLGSFGAIIFDPPYGIGAAYDGERELSGDDYWPWLERVVAAARVAAPVVVMTHRVEALAKLRQTWDWICPWTKPLSSGVRAGNSPVIPTWEPIFVWGLHSLGVDTKGAADVFRFAIDKSGARAPERGRAGWAAIDNAAGAHPTPKPLPLMRAVVATFGQKATTLLDPFCGSGTTLRAGKDLGLHVTGVDRSERYCQMTVERLGQGNLFGAVA